MAKLQNTRTLPALLSSAETPIDLSLADRLNGDFVFASERGGPLTNRAVQLMLDASPNEPGLEAVWSSQRGGSEWTYSRRQSWSEFAAPARQAEHRDIAAGTHP